MNEVRDALGMIRATLDKIDIEGLRAKYGKKPEPASFAKTKEEDDTDDDLYAELASADDED